MKSQTARRREIEILLYIPNIIGYIRLVLLLAAYLFLSNGTLFVLLYGLSAALDFCDGWAARVLNQRSTFGAWLDVIIDNLSRGLLWTNVCTFGFFITSVEWIAFLSNYRGGGKWREMETEGKGKPLVVPTPAFVKKVMANGFKTPLGALVISGLHILPLWLYAEQNLSMDAYIHRSLQFLCLVVLVCGRSVCLAVEFWCIYKHIREMLWEDLSTSS